MDKPINLFDIRFYDKDGNKIVREEYNIIFGSHDKAELFIGDRKRYWSELFGIELVIEPRQNETIEEIEIQKVFKLTAKKMGISERYVFHKTRSASIIDVRRVAIAICLEFGLSVSIIGHAIGFNHTTIIHHRKKFIGFCQHEPGYEDRYIQIKDYVLSKLNGSFKSDGSGEKLTT